MAQHNQHQTGIGYLLSMSRTTTYSEKNVSVAKSSSPLKDTENTGFISTHWVLIKTNTMKKTTKQINDILNKANPSRLELKKDCVVKYYWDSAYGSHESTLVFIGEDFTGHRLFYEPKSFHERSVDYFIHHYNPDEDDWESYEILGQKPTVLEVTQHCKVNVSDTGEIFRIVKGEREYLFVITLKAPYLIEDLPEQEAESLLELMIK